MTCPDPTIRFLFVHWIFNIFQVIGIIVTWKVIEFLWKMARPAMRLFRRK